MTEKKSCILNGRETRILFASGMADLARYLSSYGSNVFWVFDSNTAKLFRVLPKKSVILEPGEKEKNLQSLEKIIGAASDFGLARDSRFIAFGGGVVCDMTALAASLYMRGARLTLIPTTLLSMVDASVGGKTAVDYGNIKNLIGTFYPADEVLIAADTLKHLPEYEYRCGLGEVLKHAFITDDASFHDFLLENRDKILSRDRKILTELVERSLDIKKSFIEEDPEDKLGRRAMLNFGHTFGHALESLGTFSVSHGEGVVWGISCSVRAGMLEGVTTPKERDRVEELLSAFGYDTSYRIPEEKAEEFLSILKKDKKSKNGVVQFVILSSEGPVLFPVADETVLKVITK